MRVSLPVSITCCMVVVMLSWWLGTRSKDYLTPPGQSELDQIRIAAAQTNPTSQGMGDALSPSSSGNPQVPIPVILPKHVQSAPQLDDYLDEANLGADYLSELAQLLSEEHPLRALTCWERVIDSSKADDEQIRRASKAIAQLKKSTPPWNDNPDGGIPIVIQAGTGPKAADRLQQALDEVATYLRTCSSGILQVHTKVSAGTEDLIEDGRSPVAMWISGFEQGSSSTDVVSFFIPVDTTDGLSDRIHAEIYRIIRHHLGQMDNFQPLPKPDGQNPPYKLLEGHVTRMLWKSLGDSLQK